MDKLFDFFKENSKYVFILIIILVLFNWSQRVGSWFSSLISTRGRSSVGESGIGSVNPDDWDLFSPQQPTPSFPDRPPLNSTITVSTAPIIATRVHSALDMLTRNQREREALAIIDNINFVRSNVILIFDAFGTRRKSFLERPKNLRQWVNDRLRRSSDAWHLWDGFLKLANL